MASGTQVDGCGAFGDALVHGGVYRRRATRSAGRRRRRCRRPSPSSLPDPLATPEPQPQPGEDALWAAVSSWVYQLSGYKDDRLDEIAGSAFDLAVIDLARDGSTDFFTRSEVGAVQATGKVVLAYFEIGAIEDLPPRVARRPV